MFYLFRLRATIKPATPNPINASDPGSGTAAMLPFARPGGFPAQPPGVWLQRGLSASRVVDTSNNSPAIIVFIIIFYPWGLASKCFTCKFRFVLINIETCCFRSIFQKKCITLLLYMQGSRISIVLRYRGWTCRNAQLQRTRSQSPFIVVLKVRSWQIVA
jgi:hypothetical protein